MRDNAARREQQREFSRIRQAERGDYDADRGDYDADRGDYDADRGDYDADRGDYDADRGDYDADRGAALGLGRSGGAGDTNQALADIFRKAAGLGGHLVVAFVAPIGASSPMSRRRFRRRASSSVSEAAAARAHVAELAAQLMQTRVKAHQQGPVTAKPSNDDHVATQTSAYTSTQQSAQTTSPPRKDSGL